MKAEEPSVKPEVAKVCKNCKHYSRPKCKRFAEPKFTARKSTCPEWARR